MADFEIKRLSRLVAIQTILQAKQLVTASEMARRFEVSVRTIYRDIRALEESGMPILTVEGKGYAMLEGYRLAPVAFTQAEANALMTVEQLILNNQDVSLVAGYGQAMSKLRAVMRSPTLEKADFVASRMKVYANARSKSRYLTSLQRALADHQPVRLAYRNALGESTHRTLEPFALLMSTQQNWLLVGWCNLRNNYRIFRLDRIEHLHVLEENFTPHALTLKQYFESLAE